MAGDTQNGKDDCHIDRSSTKPLQSEIDSPHLLELLCETHELHGLEDDAAPAHPVLDMILRPCPFAPFTSEDAAITLKEVMVVHFQEGATADDVELLAKHVVVWMQQLHGTPCVTMWSFDMQKALNAYTAVRKVCEAYCSKRKVLASTLRAAQFAAQKSLEHARELCRGRNHAEQHLEQQGAVLCKWVSQQQQKCETEHHEAQEALVQGICAFKGEVKQLLQTCFEAYLADIAPPPPVDEDELFKELNAGLQARLDDLQPERVDPLARCESENPEFVATAEAPVFQKVQGMAQALSSQISPGKQAILHEKLGAVFKEVMPASSKPNQAGGQDNKNNFIFSRCCRP